MREGCDAQCSLEAGHAGMHAWGEVPARTFTDEEDGSDNEERLQEVPQMLGDCGREVQGQAVDGSTEVMA
jgi:hypothetical protein